MSEFDIINKPMHYNVHPSGVQPRWISRWMCFDIGSAFKYIWRSEYKNGMQDIEKALNYVEDQIAHSAPIAERGNAFMAFAYKRFCKVLAHEPEQWKIYAYLRLMEFEVHGRCKALVDLQTLLNKIINDAKCVQTIGEKNDNGTNRGPDKASPSAEQSSDTPRLSGDLKTGRDGFGNLRYFKIETTGCGSATIGPGEKENGQESGEEKGASQKENNEKESREESWQERQDRNIQDCLG